mgnify:FL=1
MKIDSEFFCTPIAHRGLHSVGEGFPENSIESIERALRKGYGIEIDVQISLDKQAIVFHDYELERLTGQNGLVANKYATELSNIKLLGGYSGLPLLSDILNLVDGRQALLIEIKDQDGKMGKNVGELESEVARLLDNYNGPVAVMSFNPNSIDAYRLSGGKCPIGLVTDSFSEISWPNIHPEDLIKLRKIESFDKVSVDFISHDFKDLHSTEVAKLREKKVPILSWTIKSEADEEIAREYSDNITFEGYMAKHIC